MPVVVTTILTVLQLLPSAVKAIVTLCDLATDDTPRAANANRRWAVANELEAKCRKLAIKRQKVPTGEAEVGLAEEQSTKE